MTALDRITLLYALGVLPYACSPDKRLVGPDAATRVAAEAAGEDQAAYGPWGTPVNLGPVINSAANEQHPAISRDGLSLYVSSDRTGGFGGTDIWVSRRASRDDPWGPLQHLGPNINSAGNDLAPTFTPDGHRLYFHSTGRGGCGLADLFVARRHDKRDDFAWEPAENLGCVVNGPYADAGPTYFEDEATGVTTLYFTVQNNPPGSDQGFDIYATSRMGDGGAFGAPILVPELTSPFRDTRTAIRRDGLEIFLSSGRPGDQSVGVSAGSEDLWVSTRATTSDAWSTPRNLNLVNQQHGGPAINSAAFDGAPALSFDGTTLYFFSERGGGFGNRDLYVTTRTRLRGPDREDAKVAGQPGTWTSVASLPTARLGLAAATGKHGIIYALGGSTTLAGGTIVPTVEAYDQKTGTWSRAAPMPTPRRYLMAAADRRGRIYAIGGALAGVFRTVVERYDPTTGSWSAVSPLPVALCCGGATTGLDGRIYVIGGFANGNVQLSAAEAYDPETDTWATLAPLPAPRAGKLAAVAAPDGRIYAIGGINGVTTVATMDAYDPCTDAWTPAASMPTARRFLDAVLGRGGVIYALGGTVGSVGFPGTQELTAVEAYDRSADAWMPVTPLSTPRGALAAAVGRAGTIFAIGGFDGTSALSSVETFTPGHPTVVDEDSDDGDVSALGRGTLCH